LYVFGAPRGGFSASRAPKKSPFWLKNRFLVFMLFIPYYFTKNNEKTAKTSKNTKNAKKREKTLKNTKMQKK
jgi:hypothetical protein